VKLKQAALAGLVILSMSLPTYAEENKPAELIGDTIEYVSKTGVITATGNVRMMQDGAVATGAAATYDTKKKTGEITGGVVFDKEDLHMTAEALRAVSENHLTAVGDVVLTKADSTAYGSVIDYYSDADKAVMPNGGRLVSPDATITADYMESFVKEDRAVANGSVHIVSDTKNIDATGDNCEYFGSKETQGKAILTGNAVVVQDGNTIRGNRITILLDDSKNVQAKNAE
jgi:lipopolysaccharide export system protein LptA